MCPGSSKKFLGEKGGEWKKNASSPSLHKVLHEVMCSPSAHLLLQILTQ